jgi:uncharacterized lipoprotein YddW (UPF0748 family)
MTGTTCRKVRLSASRLFVLALAAHLSTCPFLITAPLLWPHIALAAGSAEAELLTPVGTDVPGRLILHGTAQVLNEKTDRGLKLPGDAYSEWSLERRLTTEAGTISMWVQPLWALRNEQSHVFATFKWSGADESYFALSQGWWEPQGQRKLYVVLSNQQFVFCFMPWIFDYTLYLPNQWTMLAATWQSGNPGYLRLFVDGKRVCERKMSFAGGRRALDPVFLGSDAGAGVEHRGRLSDMVIADVATAPRASSDEEVHSAYIRHGGVDRSKWLLAIVSNDSSVNVTHERRMIQDEDTSWASSKLEIRRRIDRVKLAGFNVYTPCVWDGAHAFYAANNAPVAPAIRDAADPQHDPLAYLIAVAHAAGIQVHPWFVIARRPPGAKFPESYVAGAPEGGFNVQSKQFRNFIVALVVDVVRRYDIDGINLDYVRAIGPCSDTECTEGYSKKYGRSLQQDWDSQEGGTVVPSLIEWNRSAMTDIVRSISDNTRRLKPHAIMTIDTVPFDHSRQHQGLDEAMWLNTGMIDAIVDMSYEDPIDIDTLDRSMRAFTPARQLVAVRDYDLFGDKVVDRSGDVMSDYVRLIRTRWPSAGIAFYHYPHLSTEQIASLSRGVFAQAATPAWTR